MLANAVFPCKFAQNRVTPPWKQGRRGGAAAGPPPNERRSWRRCGGVPSGVKEADPRTAARRRAGVAGIAGLTTTEIVPWLA
jgi:hypothetical protein